MPEHEMTDQELVQLSLEDLQYFGMLIQRYELRLIGYVLRISSFRKEEAEEIVQESFLKAWKKLNDFDKSLSFSSWIYRITHNETISAFRKHQSRGRDQTFSLDNKLIDILAQELDIEKEFDRKHAADRVHNILDYLTPAYREVLVLKYFEDKSYEEISDILQKPAGTVANLLNRAKKAFRQSYLHQHA